MNIESILKGGKYFVREEIYCIVKSNRPSSLSFATINDGKEITNIVPQFIPAGKVNDLSAKDVIEQDRDWRIITFDMELPFELVGFISTIAKALAEENISIFVISAFSTDHLLVKDEVLNKTISVLNSLGLVQRS